MIAVVISLSLILICFKLPIAFHPAPKPWASLSNLPGSSPAVDRMLIPPSTTSSPKTIGAPADPASTTDLLHGVEIEERDPVEKKDSVSYNPPGMIPILDHAEIMPTIRGGLGAYYILIEYPEEAIQQGIEGKLTLTFTVNEDGTTSDIIVSQPLHTLLDSAAVQALRRTQFIPGQHRGRSARIRMRLPVRFKLIEPVDPAPTSELNVETDS